jgi:hypothetical protein
VQQRQLEVTQPSVGAMPSCNLAINLSKTKALHSILPEETEEEVAERMMNNISCSLNALMSCVGESLGLYSCLQTTGPCSPTILAERLGLSERWVREWLYQQVRLFRSYTDIFVHAVPHENLQNCTFGKLKQGTVTLTAHQSRMKGLAPISDQSHTNGPLFSQEDGAWCHIYLQTLFRNQR